MGKSWTYIQSEMLARRRDRQSLFDVMADIGRRYRGDYVIPYGGHEAKMPPLAAHLIADAIDHTAMNAASVMPDIYCPALDPTKSRGKRSAEYANIRRRSLMATQHKSGFHVQRKTAFRQLVAYGTFAQVVVPDFVEGCPRIELRDPLHAFPEPQAHGEVRAPNNVGFIYGRSRDWILHRYPQASKARGGVIPPDGRDTEDIWDIVEWMDEEELVIGVMGPRRHGRNMGDTPYSGEPQMPNMELERWENPSYCCPAICPTRVTLDGILGQVKNIVSQVDFLNRIMALDVIGTEKLIFPERVIVGSSQSPPKIISNNGKWRRGTDPEPNIVLDVTDITTLQGTIDPNSRVLQDRLERNARTSAGIIPQFGGETYGALRTGRANDSIMGAALEPRIGELQETAGWWESKLNEVVLKTFKGYWPSKKFFLFSGRPGDESLVELEPEKHIETTLNVVSYAIPGANSQQITVELSQMLGAGAIAMRTYREKHPNIDDPAEEERQVMIEQLDQTLQAALFQGVGTGTIAIEDVLFARRQIMDGVSIGEALEAAQKRAQERQAQAAPEPAPDGSITPEMAPGMNPDASNALGAAAGEPEATIGPSPNQEGLFRLIGATRAGLGR